MADLARYSYEDASGEVVRIKHKFRVGGRKQYSWTSRTEDGWLEAFGEYPPALYHLPEVVEGVALGEEVYVCEGEKDADAVRAEGYIATTPPQNGAWPDGMAAPLAGARVWVCWDRDPAGHKRAHYALRALKAAGAAVLGCLRALVGVDVTDHLERHHGIGELVEEDPPKVPRGAVTQYDTEDAIAKLVEGAGDAAPWVEAVLMRYQHSAHAGEAVLLADEEVTTLPPPGWLIHGFVPAVGMTAVWGSPGVGKSTLADDWQDQVRRGGEWNGWPVRQGCVLCLAGEGAIQYRNRILALNQARGSLNGAPPRFLTQENWDITTMRGLARVVRAAWQTHIRADAPLALVEIDPVGLYGARTREGVEDTENMAMATWALAWGLGCAVVVLQHANATGLRGRGTDHLRMYSETYCRLEAMGASSVALSHDGKNRQGELLAMRFERLSVGPGPVLNCVRGMAGDEYTPDDVAREQQERGEEARAAGIERRAVAAANDPDNWAAVLDALKSGDKLSQRAIADVSGVPRAKVSGVMKALHAAGKVTYEESQRGALWSRV
jgi:hypothetical protein